MTQVSNKLTRKKPSFSAVINQDNFQQSIKNALQTETKAKTFTSSIISAVQNNPALQDCSVQSIVTSALLGESLNLSPSAQLGHYYLVPYENRNQGVTLAQFQIGLTI